MLFHQVIIPELLEQILCYCSREDAFNLAYTCSNIHSKVQQFLFHTVKVPPLGTEKQRSISGNVLQLLSHTKCLQMESGNFEDFTFIFAHCQPKILHVDVRLLGDVTFQLLGEQSSVEELYLVDSELLNDQQLEMLCIRLTRLRKLHVIDCASLTNASLECVINNLEHIKELHLGKLGYHGKIEVGKLSRLSSLQKLALGDAWIEDVSLKVLSELLNLKELVLGGWNGSLTDLGVSYLKKLCFLEKLVIENPGNLTDVSLASISVLSCLKILNIGHSNVTDWGLYYIQFLTSLEKLDLNNCSNISGEGLVYLKNLHYLHSLNLSCCSNLLDKGLLHLQHKLSITDINLGPSGKITDVGLAYICSLKSLRVLQIEGVSRITDHGLPHIRDIKYLEKLYVGNCCNITHLGLLHISNLSFLSELELCFDRGLRDKGISDNGFKYLGNITSLRRLKVAPCKALTSKGLACVGRLTQIRELSLIGSKFENQSLCHLQSLIHLQKLCLGSLTSGITDDGLTHLTQMFFLKELNLAFCALVTDRGIACLSGLSGLQKLILRDCNKITDKSLEHLSSLSKLKELDLTRCRNISDNGIIHLQTLYLLETLNLDWCQGVTDKGLAYLKCLTRLKRLYGVPDGARRFTPSGKKELQMTLPFLRFCR